MLAIINQLSLKSDQNNLAKVRGAFYQESHWLLAGSAPKVEEFLMLTSFQDQSKLFILYP